MKELWPVTQTFDSRVFLCQAEQSSAFLTFPAVLCTGLMEEVAEPGLGRGHRGHRGHSIPPAAAGADPALCFHGAPYAEAMLHSLGRSGWELL